MRKTITVLAITASSSSAFALRAPTVETINYCLNTFQNDSGATFAGTCDQSANNTTKQVPLLENGCAAGQISLEASKYQGSKEFSIVIYPCLPPNIAQL
jgi:hypothetical protein